MVLFRPAASLAVVALLAACSGQAAVPAPAAPAPPAAAPSLAATTAPQASPTSAPSNTPLPSPTIAPSATPLPPSPTPLPPSPTPTTIPSPTATLAPSPTPEPHVAFEVVQHAVRRTGGDVYVVGTARNTGTLDASSIVITVSLLDDSGAVLASGESNNNLVFVEAGRMTPFSAPIEEAPDQWASERIEVVAEPMSSFLKDAFTHDIEPLDVRIVPAESVSEAPHVAGELRNASEMPLMLVKIVVAAYDADGTLLDVQSRTVLAEPRLEPGQSASFEVFFLRLDEVPAMEYVVEGIVAR